MDEVNPTPRPWRLRQSYGGGSGAMITSETNDRIAFVASEADAQLIIDAVNKAGDREI